MVTIVVRYFLQTTKQTEMNNELIKEVIKIIDTELYDVKMDYSDLPPIDQDKIKAITWSLINVKKQILKLTTLDNTKQTKQTPPPESQNEPMD